jgi:hypothetical protein
LTGSSQNDLLVTATSGHDSFGDVTEDFNTSNSPIESELSENGHLIRNIDEGTKFICYNS